MFGGSIGGRQQERQGLPGPVAEAGPPTNKKPKEPKQKSVFVRKEFPETWLWTEEMVK